MNEMDCDWALISRANRIAQKYLKENKTDSETLKLASEMIKKSAILWNPIKEELDSHVSNGTNLVLIKGIDIEINIVMYKTQNGDYWFRPEHIVLAFDRCESFKDFFCVACAIKNFYLKNKNPLSSVFDLIKIIREYIDVYGKENIEEIEDLFEIYVFHYEKKYQRKHSETSEVNYKKEIIKNFSILFPKYRYIGSEVVVKGIGRIDILAEEIETKRPVIIELKMGSKNPIKQLLAYSHDYVNPILIGITEITLDSKTDIIKYLTYDELIQNLHTPKRKESK
jgi:hypothetical protein